MTIWSAWARSVHPAELTGILGDLAEVGSLELNVDTCTSALSWIREIKLSSPSSRRRMASLEEAKIILLLTGASSGDLRNQPYSLYFITQH